MCVNGTAVFVCTMLHLLLVLVIVVGGVGGVSGTRPAKAQDL